MRTTIDILTGKPFRWNTIAVFRELNVPARCTERQFIHLHPDRVKPELLSELNPRIDQPDLLPDKGAA